jgi:hypothetical protein
MAVRKVGSGTKEWADRISKRARDCGFVPTVKMTGRSGGSIHGTPIYTVYAKQDKRTKVHDYMKLFT